jgi:hypothetical protein
MSVYFKNVKLNIDPIIVDHDTLKDAYQKVISLEHVNPKLISVLDSVNIHVDFAESFYSVPYYVQRIHTDNSGGDYVKLNFVYGGKESKMQWFTIKENIVIPDRKITLAGTNYVPWYKNQVNLVESTELVSPSIVQVGTPHSVVNRSEFRLCISLLLVDSIKKHRLTMEEACDRLHDY